MDHTRSYKSHIFWMWLFALVRVSLQQFAAVSGNQRNIEPHMNFDQLAAVLNVLPSEIGKKDIPLHWVQFFCHVVASGPRGVTTKEVSDEIGMNQGIASRMVRIMSRYMDLKTRQMEGYDVYITFLDHEYRHRQRIALSAKGKVIADKIAEIMKKA